MNKIRVFTDKKKGVISPELHSHFVEFLGSCIYDGIWVGEDSEIPNIHGLRKDLVEAMKKIQPPVIRWPGGCFADTYHWRDGIGPKDFRPIRYNENFGTYEVDTNQFGTHEFMEFCELVGARPWLNVNLMTGSVAEMREWAEYCNRAQDTTLSRERAANGHPEPFKVELWGIGNEAWDGGGKYTAESYAEEYRRYASAMPSFRNPLNPEESMGEIKLIASGADGNKPKERVAWTKDFFGEMAKYRKPTLHAVDLHFYNWNIPNMVEGEFTQEDCERVIRGCQELEEVIKEQAQLIQEGLEAIPESEWFFPGPKPTCDLYVGEWGNWHGYSFRARPALYQNSTMLDAITSALTLDIFHRNCDTVKLACVAQSVNVLNSLFLTKGSQTLLTPTYHVFDLYQVHRGGEAVELSLEQQGENLYAFASAKEDRLYLNVVHTGADATVVDLEGIAGNPVSVKVLNADDLNEKNTFEDPEHLVIREGILPEKQENTWKMKIPGYSINVFEFEMK